MSHTMETTQIDVASSNKERRGLKWVDPEFQWRYAILLLSVVLLVSTILIGTFWFHAQQILRTLVAEGIVQQHSLYQLVQTQITHLLISVFVVTALFSIFIFVMANFLSHRIVGPIFAIKKSLEKIGSGDYQGARVKLREDDEFKDVAELINKAVDKLEKK